MSDELPIDPFKSLAAFFAYELRKCREEAGLSQDGFAGDLLTTRACVTAYENLTRRPGREFAEGTDKRFETDLRFQIIWHHSRREHSSSWWSDYFEYLEKAYSIKSFQSHFIDGLLQSEGYARSVLSAGRPRDLDAAVAARLARQVILTRKEPEPPELWVLLDQAVLMHVVGGREVMRDQLAHLLKMGELPNVTIQVVPFTVGAYVALNGDFSVLGLDEGDVAYSEAHLSGRLIEDPAEVRTLDIRYDRSRAKALSDDASMSLIAELMEGLS